MDSGHLLEFDLPDGSGEAIIRAEDADAAARILQERVPDADVRMIGGIDLDAGTVIWIRTTREAR